MAQQHHADRYFDHAATTPVAPAVVAAMAPYFSDLFGNPSSIHSAGRRAAVALQRARRTVATCFGALPAEIIFTSGGTESDNTAVRGIALARRAASGANHIITSAIEHMAVLATARDLRDHYGFALTELPADRDGLVAVDAVAQALGDGRHIALVSLMVANNEVGTVQPVQAVADLCKELGVPMHVDAVQAVGRLSLDMATLPVAAFSVSAHKFYGPKGVGLLYLRSGTPFWPVNTGGGQEGGRRGGTENIPLIVGMAKALELAEAARTTEMPRLRVLRDQIIGTVLEQVDGAELTGSATMRLDNHASFAIEGVDAEGLLIGLDLAGLAASSGSACASGSQRPSHVLEAMGVTRSGSAGALRFSLGSANTPAAVEYLLAQLPGIVARVRG